MPARMSHELGIIQGSIYLKCIDNQTYFKDDMSATFDPELIVGKIYKSLPVSESERSHGLVRIVDASGEAYLYPADYFTPVQINGAPRLANDAITVHIDDITKGILHAEALAAHKGMSALIRDWIDEWLDLPVATE